MLRNQCGTIRSLMYCSFCASICHSFVLYYRYQYLLYYPSTLPCSPRVRLRVCAPHIARALALIVSHFLLPACVCRCFAVAVAIAVVLISAYAVRVPARRCGRDGEADARTASERSRYDGRVARGERCEAERTEKTVRTQVSIYISSSARDKLEHTHERRGARTLRTEQTERHNNNRHR